MNLDLLFKSRADVGDFIALNFDVSIFYSTSGAEFGRHQNVGDHPLTV